MDHAPDLKCSINRKVEIQQGQKISFKCHWKDTLSQFPRERACHATQGPHREIPSLVRRQGAGRRGAVCKSLYYGFLRKKQVRYLTFSTWLPMPAQPHAALPHPFSPVAFSFFLALVIFYAIYLLIMLIVCHHPLIPCTFHKSRNLSVSSSLMYTKNLEHFWGFGTSE